MPERVLLNYLPPASITSPSSQLSILKSFLKKHQIKTKIKYWNFIIDPVSKYNDNAKDEITLLPYFSIINDKYEDTDAAQKIIETFSLILNPEQKKVTDIIQEIKNRIISTIYEELDTIDFKEVLLFGFTAKFHQWIPAMVIAEKVKQISPDTSIVIGGFGSREAGIEAMEHCKHFDYAIYGEGEYPLLELYRNLLENRGQQASIPRLIYRTKNKIKYSTKNLSSYLSFKEYIIPDYDDYMNTLPSHLNKELIRLPINSSRSCYWNKCNFCDYNEGYKFRVREPEDIIKEIEHYYVKYKIRAFMFVDNDIFISKKHFDKLITLMIDINKKYGAHFTYWAELIHNRKMDDQTFKKMKSAGLDFVFVGYEGICDSILKKMEKSNRFIDNILFIKLSLKNKIQPIGNIIRDIYQETRDEVLESKQNLHYLRFYFNEEAKFRHNYSNLCITTMSKYYRLMSDEDKKKYNLNLLTEYLPEKFKNDDRKFRLFRWKKQTLSNNKEWLDLMKAEQNYVDAKYNYEIKPNGSLTTFKEFKGNKLIKTLIFKEAYIMEIFKLTNNKIVKLSVLIKSIKSKFKSVNEEEIIGVLKFLQTHHLIYTDAEMANIISIIDVTPCVSDNVHIEE